MAIGEELQQHFEQQVANLGCYYHICPHRHWFVTYEKKSGSNIFLGNDTPYKSFGIGLIQIRMHVSVVRILTKVHRVLELKKNLVCMGGKKGLLWVMEMESKDSESDLHVKERSF